MGEAGRTGPGVQREVGLTAGEWSSRAGQPGERPAPPPGTPCTAVKALWGLRPTQSPGDWPWAGQAWGAAFPRPAWLICGAAEDTGPHGRTPQ